MVFLYKRTIPGLTLTIGFGPQLGPLRHPEKIGLNNNNNKILYTGTQKPHKIFLK